MDITIQVTGIQQTIAGLQAMQNRAQRVTTELARDTGLIIQSEVDQVFDSAPSGSAGGSVYGGKSWSSLTEAYLKRRPDRAGGQIYRDKGELLNSLTVGGAGNITQADNDSLTFGSALPKARRLNKLREFLFVTDSMVQVVARRWELFVVEGK